MTLLASLILTRPLLVGAGLLTTVPIWSWFARREKWGPAFCVAAIGSALALLAGVGVALSTARVASFAQVSPSIIAMVLISTVSFAALTLRPVDDGETDHMAAPALLIGFSALAAAARDPLLFVLVAVGVAAVRRGGGLGLGAALGDSMLFIGSCFELAAKYATADMESAPPFAIGAVVLQVAAAVEYLKRSGDHERCSHRWAELAHVLLALAIVVRLAALDARMAARGMSGLEGMGTVWSVVLGNLVVVGLTAPYRKAMSIALALLLLAQTATSFRPAPAWTVAPLAIALVTRLAAVAGPIEWRRRYGANTIAIGGGIALTIPLFATPAGRLAPLVVATGLAATAVGWRMASFRQVGPQSATA